MINIRRAEFDDCKDLSDLILKTGGVSIYKATFGTYNLSSMIENSFVSLLSSHDNEINESETLSFISLNDGLTLANTDPDAYAKVLETLSNYIPVSTSNSMFLNFWILDETSRRYEEACYDMVKKAFMICSHIDFFVWIIPKNFIPSDFVLRLFSLINFESNDGRVQESIGVLDGFKVLFLHRSNFLPRLMVREAQIEDNDDLIPILQQSNPDILVGQESFFLADLIQNQDSVNRFYVGLKKSAIEGMLATSLDVNVSLIQKAFDVSLFPDLMIKREERPLPPPLLVAMVGDLRLVDVPTLEQSMQRLNCLFVNSETMKLAFPVVSVTSSSQSKQISESKDSDVKVATGDSKQQSEAKDQKKIPTSEAKPSPDKIPQAEEKHSKTSLRSDSKDSTAANEGQSKDILSEAPGHVKDGVSPLKEYINQILKDHSNQFPDNPPSAVVLFGYPRSENEAYERLQEMMFEFDYLVEVHDSAEETEEDEEDEFLQHHLDALEVLKDHYFVNAVGKLPGTADANAHHHRSNTPAQTTPSHGKHKAAWRKVAVSAGTPQLGSATETEVSGDIKVEKLDAAQLVAADVRRVVDHRNARIEAQRAKDREEPPKANAFAVTVFCMSADFNSRASDLVKIAFEDNPHHDYCLFMFANDKPPPPELLHCMTFVNLKPGVSFNQSLYLMHRSFFLVDDYMQVQRLDRDLLSAVEVFASSLGEPEKAALLDGARTCLLNADVDLRDNPAEVAFAVTIGRTVVGAITLSRRLTSNEDTTWFRANYHVDDLVNFERHRVRNQAVVTQWLLDPIYSSCTRRIVQDIMRQYGKTLLYYHTDRHLCAPKNVTEEFVSLKPRRRMQVGDGTHVEMLTRPSSAIGGLGNDCPLLFITKHFLSHPKDTIARRVVVVGGSAHSFALLDTLCSVPHLNFPNIFFVLETPPAAVALSSSIEESKFGDDFSGCLTVRDEQFPSEQELYASGLSHKVNLVRGHLSDIDRENKAIVVSAETVLEYDTLILATCTQDGSIRNIPSICKMHPARCADIGIFSLGNPTADQNALRYIRQRFASRVDDVVVSGSGLPVFAAVAQLLKLGVPPNRITVVVREVEGSIEGISEKNITDPLVKGILSAGVKMCWGFEIAEVYMSHAGFLSSLELKRSTEVVQTAAPRAESKTADPEGPAGVMIASMALLLCTNQVCDKDVFNAIVDCGLVFDGGLVVDVSFRTVDPSIYAVSDYTRFSRIYKDALPHASFNPRELGCFVALKILEQQLDPAMSRPHQYAPVNATSNALLKLYPPPNRTTRPPLPSFLLPRALSCDLPGGLNYFSSRLPVEPNEAISYLTNSEFAETAGDMRTAARNRNFVLKTDLLGTVVEINYLGEDYVENRNLGLLVGMHESFLNSAVHQHGRGYVTDWVEFFRQEWAAAIYQDRFPVLVHALRKSLATDKGMLMILNRVFERSESCTDNQELADQRREMLGAHGELAPETTLRTIETETMEFLKENRALLPRFHLPSK